MQKKILELPWDAEGNIRSRPNRFLGLVNIPAKNKGGSEVFSEKVHIHDPGRLKEILYPGNRVLLKSASKTSMASRKTAWDIIAGWYNEQWVLIHSGYHREIANQVLNDNEISPFGKVGYIKPEVMVGHSRIDFLVTKTDGSEILVEVKGCTLTIDGVALFPDAPTLRGTRHLETLIDYKSKDKRAALLVLIFRSDSTCFGPNTDTDPKFADTFKRAINSGIEVHPLVFKYEDGCIYYLKKIPLCTKIQ